MLRLLIGIGIGREGGGSARRPARRGRLDDRGGVGQSISALQEERLHADLRAPEHVTAAVDAITAEVGHGRLISVTVAADFISASRRPITNQRMGPSNGNGRITRTHTAFSSPDDARLAQR